MKLVNIIGHMNFLDQALIACGKTGIAQPDDALSFFSDTHDFSPIQEENPYTDPLNRLEAAMSRVGGEQDDIPADISPSVDKEALFQYVDHFSQRVTELTRQRGLLSVRA